VGFLRSHAGCGCTLATVNDNAMSGSERVDEAMAELAELVDFLRDWILSVPQVLSEALASFCGDAYTLEDLRVDLARFANVLDPSGDGSPIEEGHWPY
jgi:hypothetical protein